MALVVTSICFVSNPVGPCPRTKGINFFTVTLNDAGIHDHAAITITTVVALQLRQATSTVLPTVARV